MTTTDDVLDLDATEPRILPRGTARSKVLGVRVPAHLAAWVTTQAERERTTPSQYVATLIRRERDGQLLPDDVRVWLTRQAAQCGCPGDPEAALLIVLRHLADRWPNGARLR